jgi:short-chain fatty acids transporter
MLSWHGGLSGSAPLLASNPGAVRQVPLEQTIFSTGNFWASALLFVLPFYLVALHTLLFRKRFFSPPAPVEPAETRGESTDTLPARLATFLLAALGLATVGLVLSENGGWSAYTIELTTFAMLFLGLLFSRHPAQYQDSLRQSTVDVVPILLQFPFYFGILGVLQMDDYQLPRQVAALASRANPWLVECASYFGKDPKDVFLVATYLSACLLKLFIPSGGAQWLLQGPEALQMAKAAGADDGKVVLAIAYGNQTGNLLQPFWLLPIIALTRVRLVQVLAFTSLCFIPAAVIFLTCLLWPSMAPGK